MQKTQARLGISEAMRQDQDSDSDLPTVGTYPSHLRIRGILRHGQTAFTKTKVKSTDITSHHTNMKPFKFSTTTTTAATIIVALASRIAALAMPQGPVPTVPVWVPIDACGNVVGVDLGICADA